MSLFLFSFLAAVSELFASKNCSYEGIHFSANNGFYLIYKSNDTKLSAYSAMHKEMC